MKIKAFSAILAELAKFFEGEQQSAEVSRLVADLKPFWREELKGFFTVYSRLPTDSEPTGVMTVKQLAKSIENAGRLVTASGAAAKGRELAAVANDLAPHAHVPVHELIDLVREAQEAERKRKIDAFGAQLEATQTDRQKFDGVVADLSKATPDIVIAVAVGYVRGKPKYSSKSKALDAIRDKQFERARLAAKMGER